MQMFWLFKISGDITLTKRAICQNFKSNLISLWNTMQLLMFHIFSIHHYPKSILRIILVRVFLSFHFKPVFHVGERRPVGFHSKNSKPTEHKVEAKRLFNLTFDIHFPAPSFCSGTLLYKFQGFLLLTGPKNNKKIVMKKNVF